MQPLGYICRHMHPAATFPCVAGKATETAASATMPLFSPVLTYSLALSSLRLDSASTPLALNPLTPRPSLLLSLFLGDVHSLPLT